MIAASTHNIQLRMDWIRAWQGSAKNGFTHKKWCFTMECLEDGLKGMAFLALCKKHIVEPSVKVVYLSTVCKLHLQLSPTTLCRTLKRVVVFYYFFMLI